MRKVQNLRLLIRHIFYQWVMIFNLWPAHANDAAFRHFFASDEPSCMQMVVSGISKLRNSQLKPADRRFQLVNGKTYEILGLLGSGSMLAYLAKSPSDQTVVLKYLEDDGRDPKFAPYRAAGMYAEIVKTWFYIEQNESIPRILEFEFTPNLSVLVKEYNEGITHPEFQNFVAPKISQYHAQLFLLRAKIEKNRLRDEVFGRSEPTRARSWYQKNWDRLEGEIPKLASLRLQFESDAQAREYFDFLMDTPVEIRENNLLFRGPGNWQIFDP